MVMLGSEYAAACADAIFVAVAEGFFVTVLFLIAARALMQRIAALCAGRLNYRVGVAVGVTGESLVRRVDCFV